MTNEEKLRKKAHEVYIRCSFAYAVAAYLVVMVIIGKPLACVGIFVGTFVFTWMIQFNALEVFLSDFEIEEKEDE